MRKPVKKSVRVSFPGVIAVVTSMHNGEKSIMASAWHTPMSMGGGYHGFAIRKSTHSWNVINASRKFALNFLPASRSEWIQNVGTFSGHDFDKYEKYGITFEQGIEVDVPILTDAYFACECEVESIATTGTHEWITGAVKMCYRDDSLFLDNGLPDFNKLTFPLYISRSQYRLLNEDTPKVVHPFYLGKTANGLGVVSAKDDES